MSDVPDYPLGETLDFKFTSRAFATGIPTTLAGSPVVEIYEDNGTTQITAAETLSVDFDGVTGLNNLRVVATSGNGFESGKSYQAVISTGTVSSVSVVGEVVAQFSIERSPALRPATAGRDIVVSANGEANADMTFIHGTGLTETAGQLAGSFVKLFDVATPLLVASDVMRGTDSANTTVPDAAGVAPTAVENRQEMDSNSTELAKIGTIPALDGAGQTIGAAIAKLADDNAGADFDATTDSLQAVRDRGDAAWTTGAGGSDRLLMVDTTIATLASQTSFTLTAGSTDDDAYNNCTIVVEDASTATQKAVGVISAYTGASKTVTLKYDPAVFTMATTDKVYVLAENALKSDAANRQVAIDASGRVDLGSWLGQAAAAVSVNGVPEVDLTYIGGQAVSGNNADLKLKSLDIQNSAGTAVIMKSTGSNGSGLDIAGNVAGDGMTVTGGSVGRGVNVIGGLTSGDAVRFHANGTNDNGLRIDGIGSAAAIRIHGGLTGAGVDINGGGTSGVGLTIDSTSGNAVTFTSADATALELDSTGDSALKIGASGADAVELSGERGIFITATAGPSVYMTGTTFGLDIDASAGSGMRVVGTANDILADITGAIATATTVTGGATEAKQNTAQTDLNTLTDASGEPGQGAPPVSATLIQKVGYLYKMFRNKKTQTATEKKLYADDTTTVDQKSTVSDDATTFTDGEMGTGA